MFERPFCVVTCRSPHGSRLRNYGGSAAKLIQQSLGLLQIERAEAFDALSDVAAPQANSAPAMPNSASPRN